MIIKGKRGEASPEDDPRLAQADVPARDSALIKTRQGPTAPSEAASSPRRSSLMKRGSYVHTSADESAPPAPSPRFVDAGPDDRVAIPTGDPPPSARLPVGVDTAAEAPTVAVPSGPSVDQQVLEEAKRRAEAIVRQAQADAKKLLEESKIHCQAALEQAQQEGFAQGQQQGHASSTEEMAALILQLRQMLSEVMYAREKVFRSAEGELAKLALKIAERVTQTAVAANPEIIKNQVTHALEKVKDREHITLRVNPDDLDVVRARRDLFNKILEGPKSFEISADPKVDRGGVIIETNHGNVDARIATQLQAIQVALVEVEKRRQEAWETAAQAVQREVLEQGLPSQVVEQVDHAERLHLDEMRERAREAAWAEEMQRREQVALAEAAAAAEALAREEAEAAAAAEALAREEAEALDREDVETLSQAQAAEAATVPSLEAFDPSQTAETPALAASPDLPDTETSPEAEASHVPAPMLPPPPAPAPVPAPVQHETVAAPVWSPSDAEEAAS